MICFKCRTENPDTRKFCRECGAKLLLVCPQCGTENFPDDKFCGECGYNFNNLKEARPTDYSEPQSYTPKYPADKILTTRSSIEGERKLVTVLFADVAGYTSISEKLDPEIVHQLMDGCFKILMEEIHKHEGTINQFTGDGIMALFGAPLAHEDHAQRACYAALSIQRALVNYEKKINKNFAVEFRMRIGLHQLSKKSSTELIHSILREGRPVPELKELILDRAAGNPLYMEEFTHTLVECGAIRCEDQKCMLTKDASGIQVPDTIQGIIAARMDRLEDDLKRTMQVASVIGRDFAFRKKAEQINDTGIMASTGGFLCLLYWWSGECRRVIDLAPKIITLLENAGRQSDFFGNPYNLYSVIHAWYANCSAMLGNFEEATSHIEKGIGVKSPIRAGIFLPGRALFGCG